MFTLLALLGVILPLVACDHQSYVVGGQEVETPGKWPSMCSLQLSRDGSHWCGCAILSQEWVVTAAHCIIDNYKENFQVTVGLLIQSDHSVGNPKTHTIKEWVIHEGYVWDYAQYPNDIAVIRVETMIDLEDPIVGTSDLALADDYDWIGSTCYVVGWGKIGGNKWPADQLKEGKVYVISRAECTYWWNWYNIQEWHVCVTDTTSTKTGTCNGDSGGPLFCERGGHWYQLGVFSWMAGNCDPDYPAIYTRVPLFIDWLEYHTGLRFE